MIVAYECMACRTLRLSDDPVINQQRLECKPCGHPVMHRPLIRDDEGRLIYSVMGHEIMGLVRNPRGEA